MRIDDRPLEELSRLFVEEQQEADRILRDLQDGKAVAVPDDRKLGKYILIRQIGRGGLGKVWLAWEPELKRTVAVKILADEHFKRLRREAQMLAQLDHPRIATVYDIGEAHGMPYIAMQYIDGRSLDGATLPAAEAARVVREAARIVQAAHDRGIIHRDLKPANLMLQGKDVYVIDFGLAKPVESSDSVSATGAISGTVAYMSPEQAAGETLGPDTDIYSLGATLYRLAAGHAPFEGGTLRDVMNKIAARDVPHPPNVPADLEAIILKAMEAPGTRYPSAGRMADDLDRFLRDEPIEAQNPSRLSRILRRHKASAAIVSALLLVFVALAWRTMSNRNESARLLAAVDRHIRDGDFDTAAAILDDVIELDGLTPEARERRSRILDRIGLAEQSKVEAASRKLASARSILEQAKLNLYKKGATFSQAFFRDLDQATSELRESLSLAESAEAHYLLGSILSLQGLYEEALNQFDLAKGDPRSGPAKGRAYIDMAVDALFEGREQESTLLLESARSVFSEGEEGSELVKAWSLLAQGDNRGAIEYARERTSVDEEFWVVMGVAQARLKQPREAVRCFSAAIDRRPNYYQAFFYRGYAVKLAAQNSDYALREYDQAIAIYPHYVRALLARAEIRAERGERDLAAKDWGTVQQLRPDLKDALERRIRAER